MYAAKSVLKKKNKKIDTETFLYETPGGILDTEMIVASLEGLDASRGDKDKTFGTLELRLYVTRQLGVTHTPQIDTNYIQSQGSIDGEFRQTIVYKYVAPTLRMTFEENAAPLDAPKASRELRRVYSEHPGTAPWAIFRFHYRSQSKPHGQVFELL